MKLVITTDSGEIHNLEFSDDMTIETVIACAKDDLKINDSDSLDLMFENRVLDPKHNLLEAGLKEHSIIVARVKNTSKYIYFAKYRPTSINSIKVDPEDVRKQILADTASLQQIKIVYQLD